LLTALMLHAAPALGQPAERMVDPMRPPNAVDAAPATADRPASAPIGVQVILTSHERKVAVIDGKVVPLGGSARDGKLVGLTDTSAVLEKGQSGERDVLLMHPNIDKKPPSRRTP
jgi:hypothetical protein